MYCGRVVNRISSLENGFGSFKIKAKHTKPNHLAISLGYCTPEKLESKFIQKHVHYAKVDSSFIHNHQKLEAIQVSFDC